MMSETYDSLAGKYRHSLELYLQGAGERALQTAYELGRSVIASSLGVLDLAKMHQDSIAVMISVLPASGGAQTLIRRAAEFFVEALSPFEMTHRGFQETISSLSKSKETLEHQVSIRSAALSRAQDQYRLITEHSSDLVYILDLEGMFIYVSPSFKKILGYSFEDLVGIACTALIHPDDQGRVADVYRRALFTPEGLSVEFRYMHKDGHYVPFESVWNWVVDQNGSPQRAVVASREVTERKKSEEKLRASEVQYRRLFEAAKEGILLIDPLQWEIRDVNPFLLNLIGQPSSGICGHPLANVPELKPLAEALAQYRVSGNLRQPHDEYSITRELQLTRNDGGIVDVEMIAHQFLISGRPVIQCVIHDITTRKRYERRQEMQHDLTRILSESTHVKDATSKILDAVCRHLQMDVGIFWAVDRSSNVLRCLEVYHSPGYDPAEFETDSRKRTFPPGTGFPGQIWTAGEPVRIAKLDPEQFERRIGSSGLKSGFGFPIRLGQDVLGVIECYTASTRALDEDLLGLMGAIGSQIGQFLERKFTEESLRESEEQYRTVAETGSDAIIAMDEYGTILFANTAAERTFGYNHRELTGKKLTTIIPDYLRYNFTASVRNYTQTGEKHSRWQGLELPGLHRSGRHIPLEISYGETMRNGRRYFIGIARDITERKRAEEVVRRSQEQLRGLSARLQTVREEERRWIAREIHDELGQALTGIKMYLSWMQQKVGAAEGSSFAPLLLNKMNSMSSLIDTTIVSIQRIVTELRPGVLDDLGLLAAIEWQAQEFENRTTIRCDLDAQIRDVQFDEARSTAIFRIFQETLTNVARHAQASRVTVRLEETDRKLFLEVHDNGKGIKSEDIAATKSLGLLGIRERAGIFGGSVEFSGAPGEGTTVSVVIPLDTPPAPKDDTSPEPHDDIPPDDLQTAYRN